VIVRRDVFAYVCTRCTFGFWTDRKVWDRRLRCPACGGKVERAGPSDGEVTVIAEEDLRGIEAAFGTI